MVTPSIDGCYIEITSACNLRCLHCYNRSGYGKINQIPLSVLRRIIEQLKVHGLTSVTLSGGEPLMHPDISALLHYIVKDMEMTVTVITNASMLTDDFIDRWKGSNVSLQISLDGATAKTHDTNRGIGQFNCVISALSRLRARGFSSCTVKMVLARYNQHEVIDFLNLVREYGFSPALGFLVHVGSAKNNLNQLQLSPEEKMTLIRRVEDYNRLHKTKIKLAASTLWCPLLASENLKLSLYIQNSGNVFPCQQFYDEPFAIGNIYLNSIEEILQSDALQSLLERLQAASQQIDPECQRCICAKICRRGCFGLSSLLGDITNKDGNCIFRKQNMARSLIHMVRERRMCV